MNTRNVCLGLLTSLTLAHFTPTALGADVQQYIVAKGQDYHQTNATVVLSVTNESPFRFVSSVDTTSTDAVTAVTLKLPNMQVRTLTNNYGSFDLEQGFTNKTLLDGGFGVGSYAFSIKSLHDGTNKPTLTLPAEIYPAVPRILNWPDAQDVEPEQPLTISWGAFTNGTTNDFVMLDIRALDGSTVVASPALTETNALNGTNLSVLIPANSLDYSNTYEGRLLFLKKTSVNTTGYPGASGKAGYFRQTKFPLVTLPPPPSQGRIQFSARNYSVAEDAGFAAITLTRSGTQGDVSVDMFTSDGTATAGLDYSGVGTTVLFHDGDTSATVPISILDDYLLEGNETVNLSLLNPTGGAELGNRTSSVLTIVDNEIAAAGKLQISPATYALNESNRTVLLTVTRTGGTTGTVSANYVTQDGTALDGSDYIATNGTVVFTNGQTSKIISVPLINDTLHETNKTFSVKLVATAGGAAFGTNLIGTVTILDDDVGGVINFTRTGISTRENGTNFIVNVTRTGGNASGVTVDYFTTGGTATADVDFVSTNGTLTFAANETNKTILVGIIDDTALEGSESFTLHLSNVTGGGALGNTNVCTLTIIDDESSIGFTNAAYFVSETNAFVTITAVRSGALFTPVSVDFKTLDGEATPIVVNNVIQHIAALSAAGTNDYRGTNGTLSFPTNVVSKTIVIPLINNTVVDGSRIFSVQLFNPQNGVQLLSLTNTTVTIADNDLGGVIAFATNSYAIAEGGTNATITLGRAGGLASGVTVDFSVNDGTATAGLDYSNVTQTLIFNAGETNKKVLVPIFNDTIVEGNETVLLTLRNATGGATLGSRTNATLTIVDDDLGGTINFARSGVSTNENNTNFVVTVTRTGGKASAVTVDYFTTGGTATADGDYISTNGTLTFAANETNKIILVPILNDTLAEGSESFTLTLTNVGGGATLGATNVCTLTIIDDESSISFTNAAYSVSETNGFVTITAVRAGALLTPVTVDFASVNDSAISPNDYRGTNGTLSFPTNVTSKTIVIPIVNNTIVDGSRSFNVQLFNPQNGVQLGALTNTVVTIHDNDLGGVISLSTNLYSVGESGTNGIITLLRTGGMASAVTVDFAVADGSATAGLDYSNVSQTVTFNAGETNKKILIPIINDTIVESAETILIGLSNPTGGASLGNSTNATLTISNDDVGGVINFTRAGISANENGTNFVVNVTRTGGKASAVTVDYFTTGGTATADADYVSTSGTLTFAANETNKIILVPILNDTLAEGSESFTLTLTNVGGGATLGATNVCTLTIVDDESSVSLASASYLISEASTNLALTVTRSGALLTAVTVDFATVGGTAISTNDYRGTNGTLIFPANVSSKTIVIPIVNNTIVDNSRTFNFRLSNPQGGVQLGSITNSLVTITNDDFAGSIQFAAATFSGTEGSNAVITLTRTGGLAGGVYIYVSMIGLTATAGLDYTNMSGYVAFNAGETNKTILVPLVADVLNEPTETVSLFFGTIIGGASIGAQNVATLNILNKPDANAIPAAGPVFFKYSINGTVINVTTNFLIATYRAAIGIAQPALTIQGTVFAGTDTKQFQLTTIKASGPGVVSLVGSSSDGLATYTHTTFTLPNPIPTTQSYASYNGTGSGPGGTVTLDVVDTVNHIATGRFTIVLRETTTSADVTATGSFRVKW